MRRGPLAVRLDDGFGGNTTKLEILMNEQELKHGQLVQLNPETVGNPMFAGCIMVVTEPKRFGAQGYVQALGDNGEPGGQAYYRAKWEEMEPVGSAEWVAA
jgi:hypothetical protein